MIRSYKDLNLYLKEDAKRNGIKSKFRYYLQLFYGSENAHVIKYLRVLRQLEYCTNTNNWIFHGILRYYFLIRHRRMSFKYHISIPVNCVGYGLRIIHISGGGGVLINAQKIGNYCGLNAGTLIGNNGGEDFKPVIGDYVAFGPGAKAFGKITIGNNVFICPNAVVTKDVPDNCIVGGVPARFIKEKPIRS